MNIKDLNRLKEKAQTKKDGVYKWKSRFWVVKDKNLEAIMESNGEIYKIFGLFLVRIGLGCRYKKEELNKLFNI